MNWHETRLAPRGLGEGLLRRGANRDHGPAPVIPEEDVFRDKREGEINGQIRNYLSCVVLLGAPLCL